MTNTVNEKSPLCMTMTFKDEDAAPLVPATAEWRLDDVDDIDNAIEIVDWTALTGMASTMKVTIPSTNNVIVNEENVREARMFGVRINVGLDSEAHQQYKYHVLNLRGPSGA